MAQAKFVYLLDEVEPILQSDREDEMIDIGFELRYVLWPQDNDHLHPVTAQAVKHAWISGESGIFDVDFFEDGIIDDWRDEYESFYEPQEDLDIYEMYRQYEPVSLPFLEKEKRDRPYVEVYGRLKRVTDRFGGEDWRALPAYLINPRYRDERSRQKRGWRAEVAHSQLLMCPVSGKPQPLSGKRVVEVNGNWVTVTYRNGKIVSAHWA
jgi:hypothetical protein